MRKAIIITSLILLSYLCPAQIFYGDFESWRDYSVFTDPSVTLQLPVNWYSTDSLIFFAKGLYPAATFAEQVYKTNDAHSGFYAAKLVTLSEDTFHVIPALFTNAQITLNLVTFNPSNLQSGLLFSGGTPVTSRIYGISVWLKYLPRGGDSATIYVQAIKPGIGSGFYGDSIIGSGQLQITSQVNSYSKFYIPITYTDTITPGLVRITAVSSGGNPHDSSMLYLDDINVMPASTAMPNAAKEYLLYPNPAASLLHIEGAGISAVSISNEQGQQVYSGGYDSSIDISSLSPGFYLVWLADNVGNVVEVKKIIKR